PTMQRAITRSPGMTPVQVIDGEGNFGRPPEICVQGEIVQSSRLTRNGRAAGAPGVVGGLRESATVSGPETQRPSSVTDAPSAAWIVIVPSTTGRQRSSARRVID